ncbi:DUF6492 family protein [Pseudomonas fulva]|uniref:DUF6492 family protein n=1 Tax=Pseudomonas fulva TaxID=47880 RepID=UPI000F797B48|nr:DUF6492 family protein [Pseudomonas fulva]MBA1209387.1 hypothetical protein [Pseudomonas fulva]MBA1217775.1 hypothetical protein [Pseudomonas fulva]MDH0573255.1 DUF6492 family protein [Pseudomonas fulva]RRW56919.1 hypothetical protein EGJ51_21330 [Pseudomonas fulva]
MSIEIHTVTFGGDIRLMELQALSADQMFEHDSISKYRIVVNDKDEINLIERLSRFFKKNVSEKLANKIELIGASKYISLGDDGWKDQQYLKLYSVQDSDADWVIVLDSKNHFVKPTSKSDFFDGKRAKTYFIDPPQGQQPWLKKSLSFFAVTNYQNSSMPTVTPYAMRPKLVGLMLDEIKSDPRTAGHANMFESPALERASEFFLYFAFLMKKEIVSENYSEAPRICETLYTVWPQDRKIVQRYLNSLLAGDFHLFGLHRKRLPQLNEAEKLLIDKLWQSIKKPEPSEYYLEFIG